MPESGLLDGNGGGECGENEEAEEDEEDGHQRALRTAETCLQFWRSCIRTCETGTVRVLLEWFRISTVSFAQAAY